MAGTGRTTVLITGATGILGGATLAELLRARPDTRVLALVRAATVERGVERVCRSLRRFGEPGCPPLAAETVEILPGDLTEPSSLDDVRLDTVTHVVHAAANTSFRSVRSVRKVNILGTLALAHRMRRVPVLERFVHVGTAYSCGLWEGPGTLLGEDDYPRDGVSHLVEYTSAKAEAERLLECTAPELPLVIVRPSVIVGHSRLGCGPSASLFWLYRTLDLLRRVPWPMDTREDIVPVDYAARALVTLLFSPQLPHRRYHVSAGTSSACSWHELARAFARHHGERAEDPYRVVDVDTLVSQLDGLTHRLGSGDVGRLRMALGLYCRFPGVSFDNSRLIAAGLPPPPRFVDYLDLCMTRPSGRTVYQQMTDDD